MPDDSEIRFLRLPAVQERVGLRKTVIYALIKEGGFPAPRHLRQGRIAFWVDAEIRAWQQAQLAPA